MRLSDIGELMATLSGVRRTEVDGLARWRYHDRMVAREIDKTHVVIRAEFKYRNEAVRRFPKAFNVPPRYATHMMVVADLNGGWDDAVGDVIVAAWDLQRRSDYSSGSTGR